MEVSGWRRRAEYVKHLTSPAILFWEFCHFVVLEGVRNNRYYINDPANGYYSLDAETFKQRYTGILLLLEPRPSFRPDGQAPTMWSQLLPRIRGQRILIGAAVALGLLLAVPTLAVPELPALLHRYRGQRDRTFRRNRRRRHLGGWFRVVRP